MSSERRRKKPSRSKTATAGNPVRDFLSGIVRNGRSLLDSWDEHLSDLSPEKRRQLESRLADEMNDEKARAPRIAIIGKTGVGKSSTINALFRTTLHVSHVSAGTLKPQEIAVSAESLKSARKGKTIKGRAGDIVLYDMPGLGEDIDKYDEYQEMYADVLSQCDVAVWVLAAHERVLGYDQVLLRDVVRTSTDIGERIVIGLNQVDLMQPGAWNTKGNIPSPSQRISIQEKMRDVHAKLAKVIPGLRAERIIPYAAKRHYRLPQLFDAMMDACPPKRAWVLHSRESLADFLEFVAPEVRARLNELEGSGS